MDGVRRLLDAGLPVNGDPDGTPPLHDAAWRGHRQLVVALLRRGDYPGVVRALIAAGATAPEQVWEGASRVDLLARLGLDDAASSDAGDAASSDAGDAP